MRNNIYRILFLLSAVSCQLSAACYAQPLVSSTELIEKAKELDGKEVVYEGEVIGEVMTRGEYSWVNLNDGLNAVGVWMGNNSLGLIYFGANESVERTENRQKVITKGDFLAGGYKFRGDWLQVRGVFNRACRLHGGDLDIHAQDIIKIRSGRAVKHRLVPEKKRIALILAGVCLCLLIGQLLSRKLKTK